MIDISIINRIVKNHSLVRHKVYECTEDDKYIILTALVQHLQRQKYDQRVQNAGNKKRPSSIKIHDVENIISRYFQRGRCIACAFEEIPSSSCSCGNYHRLREKYPKAFL